MITSGNSLFIKNEVSRITEKLQVSSVNLIEINPITSLGISDIRKISQTILLKPFGGGDRLVIIRKMDSATVEASNALLKFLEEPPPRNFIILIAGNINKLLPTIVSRCQVISDNNKISGKSAGDMGETKKNLHRILTATAGERILLSQKLIIGREEGLQFLSNLLVILEELLYKPDTEIKLSHKEIAELLQKISAAKNYLERYINFKATLDVLFLGFPKLER